MNLQDRAYAAAIFIVLGICCLGAYVAVSGFMNANPQGLGLGLNAATATPTSETSVEIPTATAAPPTLTPLPTVPPTKTPKGYVPPPTAAPTRPPTLDLPTAPVVTVTTATAATPPQAGCDYPFCPRIGRPEESVAPTGRACPTEYLWGVVYAKNGTGIPNMKVHYQQIGGVSDDVITKGPPDTRIGGYDIPAGSGTWILQLFDQSGNVKSPQFEIKARQPYIGGSTCPTRVDFAEQ